MSFLNDFFDFLNYKEDNFKEKYILRKIRNILVKLDDVSDRQDEIMKEFNKMNWELIGIRNMQGDIKDAFRAIRLNID